MGLYRAHVCDTPQSPFAGGALRSEAEAAIGKLFARGTPSDLARVWVGDDTVWSPGSGAAVA